NEACNLRVLAGLPNRLAAQALAAPGARVRFFAPAARNVADRETPVASFAEAVDVLACNNAEWQAMPPIERDAILTRVPLAAVTDGPRGSWVHLHAAGGVHEVITVAALPRS